MGYDPTTLLGASCGVKKTTSSKMAPSFRPVGTTPALCPPAEREASLLEDLQKGLQASTARVTKGAEWYPGHLVEVHRAHVKVCWTDDDGNSRGYLSVTAGPFSLFLASACGPRSLGRTQWHGCGCRLTLPTKEGEPHAASKSRERTPTFQIWVTGAPLGLVTTGEGKFCHQFSQDHGPVAGRAEGVLTREARSRKCGGNCLLSKSTPI